MDEIAIEYKKNHKIPSDVIINILKHLGCEAIEDYDYKRFGLGNSDYDGRVGMRPDFTCIMSDTKFTVAVEVGALNNDSPTDSKISRLLDQYKRVIHIFNDQKFFFLHCIIYEKTIKIDNSTQQLLNNVGSLIKRIESQEEEMETE